MPPITINDLIDDEVQFISDKLEEEGGDADEMRKFVNNSIPDSN